MPTGTSTRSSGPRGRSPRGASRRASRLGWRRRPRRARGGGAGAPHGRPRPGGRAPPRAGGARVWGYGVGLKWGRGGRGGMSFWGGMDVVMGAGAHGAPRALPAAAVVAAHIAVVTEVSRREVTGGDAGVARRALAATAAVA